MTSFKKNKILNTSHLSASQVYLSYFLEMRKLFLAVYVTATDPLHPYCGWWCTSTVIQCISYHPQWGGTNGINSKWMWRIGRGSACSIKQTPE